MTDPPTLAATLLANFRTIRFPWSDACSMPAAPSHAEWWKAAKARRAEHLEVEAYRGQVRQRLHDGHHRFLDNLEPDPDGGWRLHIFVSDHAARSVLDSITDQKCGPGDPVSFDPEHFVVERLGYLNQCRWRRESA